MQGTSSRHRHASERSRHVGCKEAHDSVTKSEQRKTREHIEHDIEPVFDEDSRVLMLGTMPSPRSREQGFFYGHPQNRFWKVIAAVLNEPLPESINEKKQLLCAHHIALWDVLASCEINGASDASIRDPRPNDLRRILDQAAIEKIFCTGAKAAQLYRKFCEPELGIPCEQLPSTSPANASVRTPDLITIYGKALRPYL